MDKKKKKKGLLDFLKNPNREKAEKGSSYRAGIRYMKDRDEKQMKGESYEDYSKRQGYKDGGTAKSKKLDALKSLMGKKKPDMIKATVMAKDPAGLYKGAEKLEEVAESMGGKKKKKDDDLLDKLKKLLKK